ncbi:MAG TPA: type IV toxin-antitoxin system AbiEi family antitoxin domain-containing protein [Pseudolysinimonas sp.]|nr:type IV toxin-antitoxin system AbiEi family antitoxin domain-containing protein [Pseudolysinimonas sp.]
MTKLAQLVPDTLIYVDDAEAAGGSGRALRDACRRGYLVRVRRGAYCLREIWEALDPVERHTLAIRATIRRVRGPFLVAGSSAAAVWGLPYAARGLAEVTLLVPYAGGGSSEPGVRRSCVSFDSAERFEVDGIPVTGLARTVLDQARGTSFGRAVAIADRVQWRRDPDAIRLEELVAELERASFSRGAAALRRVVAFSTSLSDSVGESEARAAIHIVGFETPQLQRRWHDSDGWIESDYYWESVDVAGEFDGKVKYTRDEYTSGDPSGVVWREKLREDRLRRLASGVVRLVTDDVRSPLQLARILSNAGVPRTQRPLEGVRFVGWEPRTRGSRAS